MSTSYVYKGINGELKVKYNEQFVTIARLEKLSITVDVDLDRYYECGSKWATEVYEGKISVDGTIRKAVWNLELLKVLIGSINKSDLTDILNIGSGVPFGGDQGENPFQMDNMEIKCTVERRDSTTKAFEINIYGVKFNRWDFDMNRDDWIMTDVTFMGTSVGGKTSLGNP